MARAKKPGKVAKPPVSRKAANAKGYAKRLSLKAGQSSSSKGLSDVYEYQSEKVRRSKVKLQLGREDLVSGGGLSGSEDEDEGAGGRGALRPRLVGADDDDEAGIGEDEDEEIDSDEAFEESDEERFAGFSFSHSKTKSKSKPKAKRKNQPKVKFADVDLNEASEEENPGLAQDSVESGSEEEEEDLEEEGEADEFFDVLDVLDGRADPDGSKDMGQVEHERADPKVASNPEPPSAVHWQSEEEEENEEEDEREMDEEDPEIDEDEDLHSSEHAMSASEDEDEGDADSSALQDLEKFITSLDAGQKRKAPDDPDSAEVQANDGRKQKRRLLKEQAAAGEENQYMAHAGSSKLNLEDLLAPLDSSSSDILSLKKSAKVLTSSSSKTQTLAAPLPQRTQDRLEREAAYEQTKQEVDKWSATMQRIREAEHLSFPLQAQPAGKTSNLELAAKFKPTTELESAVDKLLKSAKMREQDLAQTESLKMNHLSIEEVAERRAELAKMRELMFRAEAKAKRVAKIKSKTYRRLKKKEKAKLAAKLGELSEEDDGDEARLKREVERARERATLRHKNTGKWARAMKARGELDEDQRREIGEMLDRGEKLRRRIQGKGSGDESDEGEEDDDSGGEEGGEGATQRIKTSAFEELAAVKSADDSILGGEDGKKSKSIFEMKFMKDAMARGQQRADQMADDFIRELGGHIPNEDDEDGNEAKPEQSSDAVVERVGGRVSFRPGAIPSQLRAVTSLASDTSSVTLKSTELVAESVRATSPDVEISMSPPLAEEVVNPWLAPREGHASKAAQRKHEVAIGKNSASAEKSKNKVRKRVKKREEEKEKEKADATVDVSMANVMTLGTSSRNDSAGPSSAATVAKAQKPQEFAGNGDDSDENSELEEQERALAAKGKGKSKGVKAFEQRELVALAFAGDNVVQDFAETKRREMEEDAPHEVDTTLAGWGSWGGAGVKKAPPKPYLIKKIAGVDPKSRADYNKTHVIISEKRDKKAAKYMVKDLPYPYTSKAQFERSMEMPIGTEWNTRVGFQRSTLPKVVKKMGTIISPLEKLI